MTLNEAKSNLSTLEARYAAHEDDPNWVEVHGMTLGSEMIALRAAIRRAEVAGSGTVEDIQGR